MICEYCNGSGCGGWVHDDCPFCCGSGRATCESCGAAAEFTDDDGDYTCGDCWSENLTDE